MGGANGTAGRDLAGKVTLVTGGGGGLGEAVCRALAGAGAVVVCTDVRFDLAERVAADGGAALALRLDVTDEDQAEEAVRETVARFGRLDILINNAGVDVTLPVEELTLDQWDRIIEVNLRGPFILARLALPRMKAAGAGHIVNVISTAGKRVWPNASGYHASKWGLLGLSHALHVEGRGHGVKVTAVVSGGMRTPFLLDRFPEIDPAILQDPKTVAETIKFVLTQPAETVIPEVMVLPMAEQSWP
jgi:NAD(P)-dependent dehydrogenase (short-subunit alcohol dehydrogenase family)